jgi:hypothetical protein
MSRATRAACRQHASDRDLRFSETEGPAHFAEWLDRERCRGG